MCPSWPGGPRWRKAADVDPRAWWTSPPTLARVMGVSRPAQAQGTLPPGRPAQGGRQGRCPLRRRPAGGGRPAAPASPAPCRALAARDDRRRQIRHATGFARPPPGAGHRPHHAAAHPPRAGRFEPGRLAPPAPNWFRRRRCKPKRRPGTGPAPRSPSLTSLFSGNTACRAGRRRIVLAVRPARRRAARSGPRAGRHGRG